MASKFYNFPSFPGAFPFRRIRKVVADDKHRPLGKYSILATIAQKYTTNPGHPGFTNAAFDEVFSKFIVPRMFAQVSQKKMTAQEAVNAADREIKNIYRKWRRAGKI
jgi:ABC-type glycerol-3-phosphate transport system substrate-binding protein